MAISYNYDEVNAAAADKAASQINENGAYVGRFKKAWAIQSQNTGTHGIEFEFDSPGNGSASFTLYTQKEDGTVVFGKSFVDAMLFFFGVKRLNSIEGTVSQYSEADKGRIDVPGDVFPDLCEKSIGIVLQKEVYTKGNGGEGSRLSLVGVFQPETRLMYTEVKEKKTSPVKLDRLLKGLKTKDTRRKTDDTAQPAMGGVAAGEY